MAIAFATPPAYCGSAPGWVQTGPYFKYQYLNLSFSGHYNIYGHVYEYRKVAGRPWTRTGAAWTNFRVYCD